METNQGAGVEDLRAQELASELDCFTEQDLRALTGWTELTASARRKRGDGPPFIRFGKRVLYPKREALEHFRRRSPEPRPDSPKGLL